MLSLIMYSYGATSVAGNRASKEQFIRVRLPQVLGQPVVLLQPAMVVAPPPPILRQPVVLPQPAMVLVQPVVAGVRETMIHYKARMKVVADTLFDVVCFTAFGISRYTDVNSVQFREMLQMLSECLLIQTGNSIQESLFISKLITKKFHLPRAVTPSIKQLFFNSIYTEYIRVNETRMRVRTVLPPAPFHQTQVFVPHKPKFVAIQMFDVVAVEADDYCCGICYDEFTQQTISTLGCSHTICGACITGQIEARTKSCIKCPYCREEVKQISVKDNEIRNRITALVAAEIAKN
jgi:hypothetical protein